MKWEKITSLFWALMCTIGLMFAGTACTSDDQQQEDQEQLEEDQAEDPAEYSPEDEDGLAVDDTAAEPAPMEMDTGGDPGMMDNGLDTGMPPSVAEGLDQPVDQPMEDDMAAPADSPASFKYSIVKGDWLSKIAGRVYGDVYKWHIIHEANPSIKNPDLIYPDDNIVVPITGPKSQEFARSYGGLSFNQPATSPSAEREGATVLTTTVKTGDSLSKIAKKLLGSAEAWKQIYELNKDTIENPDMIFEGQILKINTGTLTAAQADNLQLQQLSITTPL